MGVVDLNVNKIYSPHPIFIIDMKKHIFQSPFRSTLRIVDYYDWRSATSVQCAPVTWRGWSLRILLSGIFNVVQGRHMYRLRALLYFVLVLFCWILSTTFWATSLTNEWNESTEKVFCGIESNFRNGLNPECELGYITFVNITTSSRDLQVNRDMLYIESFYPTGPVVRTTVVTCTATTPLVGFHQYPVATRCRFCQQQVVTQVTHENGLLNWLTCGGLALLG